MLWDSEQQIPDLRSMNSRESKLIFKKRVPTIVISLQQIKTPMFLVPPAERHLKISVSKAVLSSSNKPV